MFKFDLGETLRDKITGFTGVCIGRGDHITGCNTYGLRSTELDKDGVPKDVIWFDEPQVERVRKEKVIFGDNKKEKGSPIRVNPETGAKST